MKRITTITAGAVLSVPAIAPVTQAVTNQPDPGPGKVVTVETLPNGDISTTVTTVDGTWNTTEPGPVDTDMTFGPNGTGGVAVDGDPIAGP